MILMPLTFTITIGIGAGIVVWVVLQIVNQRWGEIHWLMWIVFLAFLALLRAGAGSTPSCSS